MALSENSFSELDMILGRIPRKGWKDCKDSRTVENRIVPIILTCERDRDATRKFVSSFRTVQEGLLQPLVVIDQSNSLGISGEFLSLIACINPQTVYFHAREAGINIYDSVQEAANYALEKTLNEAGENDYILFMEDDIIFSSRFLEKLHSIYLGPETGFVTLYLPGNEYGFHIIDPNRFYGTQCIMFPRKAVEEIVNNRDYMMSRFYPGYDIRWSRFLAERGYILYCTDYSYVQHFPGKSRLHGHDSHFSNRFLE